MADTTPAMRQALISALYARLNGKTCDLALIAAAVDDALSVTDYDVLANTLVAADQVAHAYDASGAVLTGDAAALKTAWQSARANLGGINSDLLQVE